MFFGESRLRLGVRPNDLDILGHVNNAVAVEYLEAGRLEWMADHDLVHGDQVVAVVARSEIDYRAELPPGPLEVRTVLESPSAEEFDEDGLNYRARFRQRIHRVPGERPAVEALITVAFLEAGSRRLTTLQDFLVASRRAPVARAVT